MNIEHPSFNTIMNNLRKGELKNDLKELMEIFCIDDMQLFIIKLIASPHDMVIENCSKFELMYFNFIERLIVYFIFRRKAENLNDAMIRYRNELEDIICSVDIAEIKDTYGMNDLIVCILTFVVDRPDVKIDKIIDSLSLSKASKSLLKELSFEKILEDKITYNNYLSTMKIDANTISTILTYQRNIILRIIYDLLNAIIMLKFNFKDMKTDIYKKLGQCKIETRNHKDGMKYSFADLIIKTVKFNKIMANYNF